MTMFETLHLFLWETARLINEYGTHDSSGLLVQGQQTTGIDFYLIL